MKPTTKTLFALGCACVITTASSFAQSIPVYTFDEFGNSTESPGLPPISPGVLQADPSGGLTVPVLVYNLPFSVIPGDVVMTEPGNPAGTQENSDIVRFWNPNPTSGGSSQIIFYSDFSATDPSDSPADTGLPTSPMPLVITIPEVGPEGNNGALYTPTPNDPGFILGSSAPVAYNIISDVPEPNALALATIAGGLLLLALKRRNPSCTN